MNNPSSSPLGPVVTGGPFGCHFIELGRHMAYLSGSAVMQIWTHGELPWQMSIMCLKTAVSMLNMANEPEDPRTHGMADLDLTPPLDLPSSAVLGTGVPAFDVLTNKVNPYLPDLGPVYRAVPQIVLGNYGKAIEIIETRIAELEAES